jgi:hypothetical protein
VQTYLVNIPIFLRLHPESALHWQHVDPLTGGLAVDGLPRLLYERQQKPPVCKIPVFTDPFVKTSRQFD